MQQQMAERFQAHFGKMTDPRVERTKLYPLQEILFVMLCGSLCGAESWRDFVMFGQAKLDWLRGYFPFTQGIPCKNTFARVSAALDSQAFRTCFQGAVMVAKSVSTAITSTHSDFDGGHGRVEPRKCFVSSEVDSLEQKSAWTGLTSIAMIEETREFKGRISIDRRFFISSLPANAKQIAQAVRAHWAA